VPFVIPRLWRVSPREVLAWLSLSARLCEARFRVGSRGPAGDCPCDCNVMCKL
jgi:hypothetical protein